MYAFALHEDAMVAEIKAYSVSVHEWGADYAVVSVDVDEVAVIVCPCSLSEMFRVLLNTSLKTI